jgi:hypothetical protein
MSTLYSDANLPKYIYICGLIGIICFAISLICFLIFYFVYHEKIDTSIKVAPADSIGYTATIGSTITFSVLGLIFCFFILYGHILKQEMDPKLVFGNKSYIEFPETGDFVPIEEETSEIYGSKPKESQISYNKPAINPDFL